MGSAGNHNYFFLRRLHSLLGIVPLSVFLLEHFFSNSFAFQGPEAFNEMVEKLQGLPLVIFLEVGIILLPLLFHAVLGLVIAYTAKNNMIQYNYGRNWAFFFQRVTGVLALIYIVMHVYETRIMAFIENRHFTFADMQMILGPTWVKLFYVVGILSVTYHMTNGLATAAITWGITKSRRSQEMAFRIMWGLFAVMSVWGISILFAF